MANMYKNRLGCVLIFYTGFLQSFLGFNLINQEILQWHINMMSAIWIIIIIIIIFNFLIDIVLLQIASFYLFFVEPLSCSPNFFHFHGGCFYVNTKNVVNWNKVLAKCNRKGGTLAKISREGLRYAFSNMLDEMRPKPKNLHIGMLAQGDWVWIDGSPLNGSLWMPGYPTIYKKTQSCAILSAGSSRIKNVGCGLKVYPLCQKQPGRLTQTIELHVFVTGLFVSSFDFIFTEFHNCNVKSKGSIHWLASKLTYKQKTDPSKQTRGDL